MQILIGGKKLDLTPSLETYLNEKLAPLAKYIKKFDESGEAVLRVELARTTKHHKKGEVFEAALSLRLPRQNLHAVEEATEIRVAIDRARDTLKLEIEKYKTKFIEPKRGGRK